MSLSFDQFLSHLTDSGLISSDEITALIGTLPENRRPQDGDQLARELVKQKKLTKFQAEQVFAGKGKSLTLGNYVILDKLGQGGMGMVLKAQHKRMKRLVALKVMSPTAVKTPDSLKRFHREVEAAAKLRHPNIVAADDADEAKGTHFLVMEYVEGSDLSVLVKKHGPLPVEQAVLCIIQAARGLEFAHEQGVIHRDIKPANLLIDAKGTVKILDMGLARIEGAVGGSSEGAGLTSTGTIMGTVDYMSPEQAMDTKHADARSDIYSLGCTLYYLLTGKVVYDGDTIMKKLMAHQHGTIPSLVADAASVRAIAGSSDASSVGHALDTVFRRMVAKRPEDRPQTMTQVIAELERCLSGGSPTIAIQPNSNTTTSGLSVGSGNELQDFLRQISGGESSTATSAAPSGSKRTAVAPSSVEAETMISSAGEGGTDPRTEQSLTIERSRGQKKKATILVSVAAAVVVLLGIMFVVRGKSGTLHLEITEELIEVTIGNTGRVVKGVKEEEVRLPLGEHVLHVKRNDLAFDTEPFEVTQAEPVSIKVERVGRRVRAMQGNTLLGHKESSKSDAVVGSPPPAAKAPFGAQQARAHQEAWAKHLGVPVEYENTIGMKFVLIPPGEFLMGSTSAEIEAALKVVGEDKHWQDCIKSEAPKHKVILTQPIYLGIHEVTQAEYEKVMGQNPSHFTALGAGKETVAGMDTTRHPVEMVSWNDAAEFCMKLSQQEKLKPFYFRAGETITPLDGTGYRLPTEAEWEHACRAGTTTKYWNSDKDEDLVQTGWFGAIAGRTHAVGELKANPFGLFDIRGNAWEWVQDWWEPTYYGSFEGKPVLNPNGPASAGSRRVSRGGDWYNTASHCRASHRYALGPTYRGSNFGFRVSLVAGVSRVSRPALSKPGATNPDRRAAEWVLSIGGNISIQENGQNRAIAAVGDLPRGACELMVVSLSNNPKVSDAGLANFKGCKNLTHLDFVATQVSDVGLAHFKDCKNLTILGLRHTQVSDAGLAHFQDCKNLISLDFGDTQVSDAGLAHFQNCKNLTHLYLFHTQVTDVGLAYFKDCKNLTVLHLSQTKVSDAGLAHFKDCKNLTALNLTSTLVTDAGLAHFRDCQNLTVLTLASTQLGDAGLAHFKDCKNLSMLELGGTKVSDAGLAHFQDCKNLTHLDLRHTQVSDAGLAHFKDCKNLTALLLDATQVSDASLERLADFPNLSVLRITKTKVTEAGVKKFSVALPRCQIVWDGGVIEPLSADPDRRAAEYVLSIGGRIGIKENDQGRPIAAVGDLPRGAFELFVVNLENNPKTSDVGLANFKDCKNVGAFNLSVTQVSDAGLAYFKDCKNLFHVDLSGTQVSDAGLVHFKDCQNLTSLALASSQVSDAGLAHFQGCQNLTQLNLDHTKVSDAGLAYFKDCKNLTVLHLYNTTQVSDAGLAHFKDCKNLSMLTLASTQVGDAGLAHFKDCKNLSMLNLGGTKVSDAGLAHLKNCQNLTSLDLLGTQVSDAGLAHLKDRKNLTELVLSVTQVSDAGLADLESLTSLIGLALRETRISLRGYEQLKAALPKCQRLHWYETNRTRAERVLALGGTVEIGMLDKPESRRI